MALELYAKPLEYRVDTAIADVTKIKLTKDGNVLLREMVCLILCLEKLVLTHSQANSKPHSCMGILFLIRCFFPKILTG